MGALLTKSKLTTIGKQRRGFVFSKHHTKIRNGWLAVFGIGLTVYVSVFEFVDKKKRERMSARRVQGLPIRQGTESIVIDTEEFRKLKKHSEHKHQDSLSI